MKPDFTLPPAPGRPLGEANIWITSIGISCLLYTSDAADEL